MASKALIRVLITTGDPDGIGWEVTAKALAAIGPKSGVQFVYFRNASVPSPRKYEALLKRKFKIRVVHSLAQAGEGDPKTLLEIRQENSAAHWVVEATHACQEGRFQALVTAPLSKTAIQAAGLSDIGHTEILARITNTPHLFMGFLGAKFSVVLASGHVPLARALAEMTPVSLTRAIAAASKMRGLLSPPKARLPMALVGVNPHAGEGGLIGKDELWMTKLVSDLRPKIALEGPLVPDSAFLPQNWTRYSVYICPYHDQGLIPFKMTHGFDRGVHLTLGLPFVRTSVDHGTAKDIFGKDKARAGSMKDALLAAIRLNKEWKK